MSNAIAMIARLLAFLAGSVICFFLAYAQQPNGLTPKSGFVTTAEGLKIHCLEAGPHGKTRQAPAILFVPGWTMPADIWEKQIAYFSKTRRVVAMDPRSQGLSSQAAEGNYPEARGRDIKAVVDQLKLPPMLLVGWPMGVTDLVAYVDQFGSDGVAGLVLVDGLDTWTLDPSWIQAFFDLAWDMQKDRPATARFVRGMYKRSQREDYYRRITREALQTPTAKAIAMLMGCLSVHRQPVLDKINRPTLIVAARGLFLKGQEDMQKRIAGSRLEVFENAEHALFVDEADRFNHLVDEFLKTIEH